MERHAAWFRLTAVVLVAVGLLTLAVPAPAQAMDPQLIMAMASVAGALVLLTAYLIVANTRDKQRAASVEGIYFCNNQEADGPMGCGGPTRRGSTSAAFVPVPDGTRAADTPMADEPSSPSRTVVAPDMIASGCPAGQAVGPMGCGVSSGSASTFTAAPALSGSTPAVAPAAIQGQ